MIKGSSCRVCTAHYVVSPASLALPPLTASDIERFLQLHSTTGENSLIRQFRQWLISRGT